MLLAPASYDLGGFFLAVGAHFSTAKPTRLTPAVLVFGILLLRRIFILRPHILQAVGAEPQKAC